MVDYDKKTDCLVGFVLPVEDNGLPLQSSYLATSFLAIETYFKTATIAKHAFLYMAQPLKPSTPAFILACLCTDNKFTAEHVLKRWTYIRTECEKRGITVASYEADGDSQELKGMRITSGLFLKPSESTHVATSTMFKIKPTEIQKEWPKWFAITKPTSISCVQDTVHIAVKLKSKLLRPSSILPMGD